VNREELRAALHAFVTPSTARGIVSVGTDLAMYAGAVILAMLVERGFSLATEAAWVPEDGKLERTWLHELRR